jgi:hypothetical protein
MKRTIIAAAAAFFLMASQAPAQTASLEATLTQLERDSWVAWQNHDGGFFDRFLADDHVEVHGPGVTTGKGGVVAHVASDACVVSSYRLDQFRFTRFNERTALLTYRAEQDTNCQGFHVPSPVWVSSLFVRRKGEWRNALYVHTPIAQ